MAETALARRVDTLEDIMKELGYQSLRTQLELAQLSKEMREFKGMNRPGSPWPPIDPGADQHRGIDPKKEPESQHP
jgi:hypothetical protein